MRNVLVIVMVLAGLFLVGYAMPDHLYQNEYAREDGFGLMLGAEVTYFWADRSFDADGESSELADNGAKYTYLFTPIKLGYNLPNADWHIYAVLPIIAQNIVSGSDAVTLHDLGLANPYLVGRWTPYMGGGFRMGPRLAVRFAGLSKTVQGATGNTDIPSGDDSWGLDFGVLCSSRSTQSAFRLDAQAGVRYLFPATYKLTYGEITYFDYEETPPITARVEIAPGLLWDRNWVTYLKGYAAFDVNKGKTHDNQQDVDSDADEAQLVGAGLRQAWEIDIANELGLELNYDISGKDNYGGWYIRLGYVGYMPM